MRLKEVKEFHRQSYLSGRLGLAAKFTLLTSAYFRAKIHPADSLFLAPRFQDNTMADQGGRVMHLRLQNS